MLTFEYLRSDRIVLDKMAGEKTDLKLRQIFGPSSVSEKQAREIEEIDVIAP